MLLRHCDSPGATSPAFEVDMNTSQFDEDGVQEWLRFANSIGGVLADLGHDTDTIGHVRAQIRPVFMRAFKTENIKLTCSGQDDAVRVVNLALHDITNHFMMALVNLSIENYQLQQKLLGSIAGR